MDDLNAVFGHNLRNYREMNKLSLDEVARRCGVSKSMLGQIERGVTSPTISTVWKIANGLKIAFTDLMTRKTEEVEIVRGADMTPLVDGDGGYRNYPLFPFSRDRPFEVYRIEMAPGAFLAAEGHPRGTEEFLTVFSGGLEVVAGGETYAVGAGDAIRFRADGGHSYRCVGDAQCMISMVIYYGDRA